MKKTNKILAASAVAIMLAPAALSALPQVTVDAAAVGTISTTTPIYDANGKNTGMVLASGSQWQLGQQITLNGVAHYQVATNEYIPASVVKNVTGSANPVDTTAQVDRWVQSNPKAGETVTAKTVLGIVDVYGNETGRTLPAGSQWKVGQILHANKMTYYQVGNNEYVLTTDVTENTTTNTTNTTDTSTNDNFTVKDSNAGKIGTVTQTVQIVDNSGAATGRTLPKGSQWKLGNFMKHDKVAYYQVATNEWIPAMDLSIAATATDSNSTSDDYTMKDYNFGQTATLANAAKVYNNSGNATGYVLPKGSQWKLGNFMKHDKVAYYQVATNEWIMGADIDNITGQNNVDVSNGSYITEDGTQAGKVATASANLEVVNGSGKSVGQTLPKGSKWKLGLGVLHYDKQLYYQVATNEYVPAIYLTVGDVQGIKNPMDNLVGTTIVKQRTYNTATNAYGQTLPANTSWKISELVVNKYGSYWGKISTNDWVWISNVKLNSGLNLKANSYYEPNFATTIKK